MDDDGIHWYNLSCVNSSKKGQKHAKTVSNNAEIYRHVLFQLHLKIRNVASLSNTLGIGQNQMQKSQYQLPIQQWDIQAIKVPLWRTNKNNKCSGRISIWVIPSKTTILCLSLEHKKSPWFHCIKHMNVWSSKTCVYYIPIHNNKHSWNMANQIDHQTCP